ncbi:MAG: hypothetical protein JWM80_2971 [Cyanobacteria bacterium RYN_339]|nr:hypothetical protein [Cyanobacteria bacterium RYN_339]
MTLSACLIVKDEAATLPRCLASLQGVVDEIVVVDTGSSDGTVAIAEAAGAKLGHFPWGDDFSAARNAALDLATGDWVLVIDADEELVVDDLAALRTLLAGPQAVYKLPLHDVRGGQATGPGAGVVRLFPRLPELRFDGRVHESLGRGMTKLGTALLDTEALHLVHHGYVPAVMLAKGKPERNLRLARLEAEEHPDRPLAAFELGRAAITADRLPEALAAWERLRAMPPSDPFQDRYRETLGQLCSQLAAHYTATCERLRGARVSACLIVKDEEQNLAKCLASLRGLVDEVVVVDTGSTDRTLEIAQAAGAKIGHFPWCDDFAAARNASLELATGDWALVIDADEELTVAEPAAYRAALAGDGAAFSIEILNLDAAGHIESRFASAPRIFRLDPAVRFDGRLHEDITAALQARGWRTQPLPGVALRHSGYTPAAVEARDKIGRNRRLAEAMTRERPDDANTWLHLASISWRAREAAPTLAAVARAQALVDAGKPLAEHRQVSLAFLQAAALVAEGRREEALSTLDRGLTCFPGHPELLYERGRSRTELGDAAGARSDFEACLAAHGRRQEGTIRAGITGFLPRAELVGLDVAAGRIEEAIAHAEAALADPACPPAEALGLQDLAKRLRDLAPASPPPDADAEGFRALVARLEADPRDADGFLELAFTCYKRGEVDRTLVAIGRALELRARPACFHLLGLALLDLGQPAWAERAFAAVLRLDPEHATAMECRLDARRRAPGPPLPDELVAGFERLLSFADPRLSACLIVRDEEANLARCLASLQGVVDEIVVVDTGSTDGTVAIAEAAGATIGHFTWCDDFSAARNAALDLATGDWVLVIDADEELDVPDAAALRDVLRDRVPGAYALPIANVDGAGHSGLEANVVRLFQRHDALRFAGRFQETMEADLAALGWPVRPSAAARLIHHGYAPEVVAERGKAARNLRLAELAAAEAPDAPRAALDLALARLAAEDWEGARAAFDRLETLPGGLLGLPRPNRAFAVVQRVQLASLQNRPAEAVALLDRALALEPGYPEFLYERGIARARLGDTAGATADLEACLVDAARWQALPLRPGVTDALPKAAMASLPKPADPPRKGLRVAGTPGAAATPEPASAHTVARQALIAGLERNPLDHAGQLALAVDYLQTGELDPAFATVGKFLRLCASAPGYQLLGVILAEMAQPGWAERCFAQALRLDPDYAAALESRLEMRARPPGRPLDDATTRTVEALLALAEPTVSACLIVRNEQELLPRALASLQGWVNEIVVVDTGSTDGTVAIAEAAGAQVGHFTWCDDFSAARNAALDLATSEWVLVIDADEELVVDDPGAFRDALRERMHAGYLMKLTNVDAAGTADSHAAVLRIFQRLPELRYRGRLHENINDGARKLRLRVPDLAAARFLHRGYLTARMIEKSKGERNLKLAALDASERPDSAEAQFNLARSLAMDGKSVEALAALDAMRATEDLQGPLYAVYVFTYQDLLRRVERFEDADSLLTAALERQPGNADFLFERGNVRYRLHRVEDARADFEACLHVDPKRSVLRPGVTDEMPRLALAQLARPRLSACLIVKDEAQNLPRCLDSLRGLADEIVVVDTGSRDETVSLALAAGARVGHFTWCDDFSAARNAALDLATGEWVLVIDADEELVVDDPASFRATLVKPEVGAFIFPIHNHRDDGTVGIQPMMRLFRRHDEVRFAGRLHEEVTRAVEALGWHVEELPGVFLDHRGYLIEAINAHDKWTRNFNIAIAEVEADTENPLAWYNVGRSSLFTGQIEPAREAFGQVARLLASGRTMGEGPFCKYVLLRKRLLLEQGAAAEAEALLGEGLERVPNFPEFHYERALLRRTRGDLVGARADLEACLVPNGRLYTGAMRADIRGALPLKALAELDAL